MLRAVNILGLTPLGPPAEAVGGIANAIEGLDTRLTAIADSLGGNRDALGDERGVPRPGRREHVRDGRAPAVRASSRTRSPMSSSWSGSILFLMVAWTSVPAVGALGVGLWLRRELRVPPAAEASPAA